MASSAAEAFAHPAVAAGIAALKAALTAASARILDLEGALTTALARVAELEVRHDAPPKTPDNSSLPPSSGFKADRAARRRAARAEGEPARKRGPKPGHRGVSRSRVDRAAVDQVVVCRPQQCGSCGTTLPETGGKIVGRQQVVELPPVTPLVLELRRLRVRCRHCGHGTVGTAPDGWDRQASFGPRIVTLAALLHEQQHVAYARLVTLFAEVFGLQLSEGALVAAVARLGAKLAPDAETIARDVRAAPVVGSDETSMRVDGKLWWAWVFQTATAAVFRIEPRRNAAVVLAFLAGKQPGTWVSDLFSAQRKAPSERYQVCLQHQLRDLLYAEQCEQGPERQAERAWAVQFAALIRRAIHSRNQYADDACTAPDFVAALAMIEAECDALLGQRLRVGQSYSLQTRFLVHRTGLWTFLHDPAVPPTNNSSEQALRPLVLHRKVTNGFRAQGAAARYADLRTVAETARRRGQSVFATLLEAAGTPLPLTPRHQLA
ncbi:MAG TPA: IS66 family transposase [Chloroflexota bacterium]